jgi:hypothetical protein
MAEAALIPPSIRALLGGKSLAWPRDRDRIIEAILTDEAFTGWEWLCDVLSEDGLRAWICDRRGGPLQGRALSYWCRMLHIPEAVWRPWDRHTHARPSRDRLRPAMLPSWFADLFWDTASSHWHGPKTSIW